MKASTRTARRMARGRSPLLMGLCTRGSSSRMRFQVRGPTTGPIRRRIGATGFVTRCMVREYYSGLTANSMKEISRMINAKAEANSPGKMEEFMMVSGRTENRMEKESS